jgi:hypothetical protein
MIFTTFRTRALGALALCAAALAAGVRASTPADAVTLGVEGRTSSHPWIAASGDFVAVVWGASAAGKMDVFVAVSRDAGQTFGAPVQVNAIAGEGRLGGELPPRVALARGSGTGDPDVVVLWTARGDTTQIKTSRSRDGGRTFAPALALQAPEALGDRGWPAVTVDAQGTAHAIWLDHRGLAGGAAGNHQHGSRGGAARDGVAMAERSSLFYASAGLTASAEREITKGVCYCCKTAMATGPDGTVYAAWRHVFAGNFRDIAFTRSRDRGRSFAAPVRVSEDGWSINGCPDDGPAMAVDRKGVVHVVWPTLIGGEQPQAAVFYSSTRDGRTFSERIRIPTLGGPKPTHPQIVLDRNDRIIIGWDELVNGKRVAAARELKSTGTGTATFGDPITLSADNAAMYPVMAATRSGVLAAWTTGGETSRVLVRSIALP